MSLSVACINVNGLRHNNKRNCIFLWLIKHKYDLVCLQETHCTYQTVEKWKKEWNNLGGGESTWNCGYSNTWGVGIHLRKRLPFNLNETFS